MTTINQTNVSGQQAPAVSIDQAIEHFLRIIARTRSKNTLLSYTKGVRLFIQLQKEKGIELESPVNQLNEGMIIPFLEYLNNFAPATEQLYIGAVTRFFQFLMAEQFAEINLPRLKEIIRQRVRRVGQRLPQFPRNEIEAVLDYFQAPLPHPADETEYLINLRDKALLLTLADTGLRVHEACNLRRGDLDWSEQHAIIIGKGNKEAIVRFSNRSMRAIKEYLDLRMQLDGASGRPIGSLPLFARHDKGAGKKIKTITPTTGRNIVAERVVQALGADAKGKITPHSFRHYFVTTVLRASGNLKLAQELARHANIAVTQRYAHLSNEELNKEYFEIFNKK